MLDLQLYNKGKRIFYRSNLLWEDAFEYLEVKKGIEVDKIDVQFFTDDGKNAIPLEDIEDLKTIVEAQRWINMVNGKVLTHKYEGCRYN